MIRPRVGPVQSSPTGSDGHDRRPRHQRFNFTPPRTSCVVMDRGDRDEQRFLRRSLLCRGDHQDFRPDRRPSTAAASRSADRSRHQYVAGVLLGVRVGVDVPTPSSSGVAK